MFFIIIFSQVEDSPSQPWEFTVLHKDPASAPGPLWEMPDSNPYTAATEDWCTSNNLPHLLFSPCCGVAPHLTVPAPGNPILVATAQASQPWYRLNTFLHSIYSAISGAPLSWHCWKAEFRTRDRRTMYRNNMMKDKDRRKGQGRRFCFGKNIFNFLPL